MKAGMIGALALVSIAALAGGTLSVAAVVPASGGRIVEVTVFPDRAEIVREARVDLPAGASTIEFAGLPLRIEPDSLRVTAKGVAATLGAVDLKEAADQPKDSPEVLAAQAEVDRLTAEMNALRAEDAAGKDLRDFVTSLKAATAARESQNLGQAKPDLPTIQAVYGFVKSSLADLAKESLARAERAKRIDKDLQVAQAKLSSLRPAASIRTRTAAVDVESKQAGALTLRLTYVAPGARWRPSYRASLDAGTGEIAWSSEGVVIQSTGEDWSGVELRLSTAAPARGVDPPKMASLLLRPIEYIAERKGVAGGFARVQMAPAAPAVAPEADAKGFTGAAGAQAMGLENEPEEEAAASEAGVVHSDYNVAFEVPGKSDVPADGRDHRVGLRQETFKGTVAYRTAPAINAAAFLVAKTTAPAAYPLLAGVVRVFAGGAYLGAYPLPETAPGSEVTVPFGIDNRIAVTRTPLPQERSESGIFGKERRIAYGFRTTVENLRDQKISLALEDRIPVSEDERIKVEVGEATTPGSKEIKDRPGILEWALDLGPHEKREVILAYVVRFPKELVIPGLD